MKDYMRRLKPIPVENKTPVDDKVVAQFRAPIGALSLATRAAVPPGVRGVELNAEELQETVSTLRVERLPPEKTLLAFCDASLCQTSRMEERTVTHILMVVGWIDMHEYRAEGWSTFSIQAWRSRKYPRAVSSTLGMEAAAKSTAFAAA
eukprot:5392627-Amphidinium_carterae.2